jgi:hypothetical protein
LSKNGKPGKQNPPQSDSSHKACQKDDDVETLEARQKDDSDSSRKGQKDDDVETLEARQKDDDVETLEVDDVETLQSQKDDDVEILQTHITKKVRFNEESNIIHTFSSSSAPAANNEADAPEATKEASTSATDNASAADNKNDDSNETDATDKVSAAATNEADVADATKEASALDDDHASMADEVDTAGATEEDSTLDDDHASVADEVDTAGATEEDSTLDDDIDTSATDHDDSSEADATAVSAASTNEADVADATKEASALDDDHASVAALDDNSTYNATSEASTTNNNTSTEEELIWKDYEKDWQIIPILVSEHRGAKLGMILTAAPFMNGGRTKHCRVTEFRGADSLAGKLGVQRGDWICKTVRSNPVLLLHASLVEWWGGFLLVLFLLRPLHCTMTSPMQDATSQAALNAATAPSHS